MSETDLKKEAKIRTLRHALHAQRPPEEVKQSLAKLQEAYESLIIKHEALTNLIEDDTEFEGDETWLTYCQEAFMSFEIEGKKTFRFKLQNK